MSQSVTVCYPPPPNTELPWIAVLLKRNKVQMAEAGKTKQAAEKALEETLASVAVKYARYELEQRYK